MLFFLWGVFRAKRTTPLDTLQSFSVLCSTRPQSRMDFQSEAMALSEPHCLHKRLEEVIECDHTSNVAVPSDSADHLKECLPDSGLDCNTLPEATGAVDECDMSSANEKTKVDCGTSDGFVSSKFFVHKNQEKASPVHVGVDKVVDGIHHDCKRLKGQLKEEDMCTATEPYLWRDHVANDAQIEEIEDKSKLTIDLSKTVSQASAPACPKRPCRDGNDESEDSVCKKLKTGYEYGFHSSNGRDSLSESLSTPRNELFSSKLVEDKLCNATCDEKIIHEDLGGKERHFFPVDHHSDINYFDPVEKSMLWKSPLSENDEKCRDEGVPNLELALGAELKVQSTGRLPFLFGVVDKKNNQDKQVEDGDAASLSLSLSFPSSNKEQSLKPVSKSDQILPERNHVNPSLLLFGGLLDK